jgi:hypothetical protein
MEQAHDAEIEQLTSSCKGQCEQQLFKEINSQEIECKKGQD